MYVRCIHMYRISQWWHTRILGITCFGGLSVSCLDRDHLETLRIHSWFAQRMSCVIARNYAQPIPHHASPNSIVVWEIRFHEKKDWNHLLSIYYLWCLAGRCQTLKTSDSTGQITLAKTSHMWIWNIMSCRVAFLCLKDGLGLHYVSSRESLELRVLRL